MIQMLCLQAVCSRSSKIDLQSSGPRLMLGVPEVTEISSTGLRRMTFLSSHSWQLRSVAYHTSFLMTSAISSSTTTEESVYASIMLPMEVLLVSCPAKLSLFPIHLMSDATLVMPTLRSRFIATQE